MKKGSEVWIDRQARRKKEDQYLQDNGWSGGRGEWRHPHITGCFEKWEALLICKEKNYT